jgi:hypothetical protein
MLACTRTVGDEVFIRGVQPLEVLQRHADLAAPCPLRAPHARRHARHRRTRSVLARTRDQFAVCGDSRAERQPIGSRVSSPAHAHPPHTHTVLLLLLLLLLPRWPLGTSSARG